MKKIIKRSITFIVIALISASAHSASVHPTCVLNPNSPGCIRL